MPSECSRGAAGNALIPISRCPICSALDEVETSYEKHGWEEETRRLPSAAARLEPAEDTLTYESERNHARRCPICGTYYHYLWSYEYFVNGSEDEEELTRLTPAQARRFCTDAEYDALIAAHRAWVDDPSPHVRRYAGRCLVSHGLACGDRDLVVQCLTHPDADVSLGAVAYLRWLILNDHCPPELAGLVGVLHAIAAHPDSERSRVAGFVLKQIAAHDRRVTDSI